MAGLGFKDFQVGEVLTSSDVDGYLMQQSVMRFADAGARGSALGTAAGTGVPLAEGMVSYLDDANTVQVYTGSGWASIGNFTAATAITATDASWTVPTLADPVVRVTVVGGGGGGGAAQSNNGSAGGTTTFNAGGAGTVTASGGTAGICSGNQAGPNGTDGLTSGNGGQGGSRDSGGYQWDGGDGGGGAVTVAYLNLDGISTVNVTIGAGGSGGAAGLQPGGDGGDGVVIFEYRAG